MSALSTSTGSLSFSASASALTIPTLETGIALTGDLNAEIGVSACTLYNLFRFTTDSEGLEEGGATDTMARIVFAGTWDSSNPDTPDISKALITAGNSNYGITTTDTLDRAFHKKSATLQFNSPLALDLFSNLTAVSESISTNTKTAWIARLNSYNNKYFDSNGFSYDVNKTLLSDPADSANPAFNIFSNFLVNKTTRFSHLLKLKVEGIEEYYVPILAGDTISFNISLAAAEDQQIFAGNISNLNELSIIYLVTMKALPDECFYNKTLAEYNAAQAVVDGFTAIATFDSKATALSSAQTESSSKLVSLNTALTTEGVTNYSTGKDGADAVSETTTRLTNATATYDAAVLQESNTNGEVSSKLGLLNTALTTEGEANYSTGKDGADAVSETTNRLTTATDTYNAAVLEESNTNDQVIAKLDILNTKLTTEGVANYSTGKDGADAVSETTNRLTTATDTYNADPTSENLTAKTNAQASKDAADNYKTAYDAEILANSALTSATSAKTNAQASKDAADNYKTAYDAEILANSALTSATSAKTNAQASKDAADNYKIAYDAEGTAQSEYDSASASNKTPSQMVTLAEAAQLSATIVNSVEADIMVTAVKSYNTNTDASTKSAASNAATTYNDLSNLYNKLNKAAWNACSVFAQTKSIKEKLELVLAESKTLTGTGLNQIKNLSASLVILTNHTNDAITNANTFSGININNAPYTSSDLDTLVQSAYVTSTDDSYSYADMELAIKNTTNAAISAQNTSKNTLDIIMAYIIAKNN